MRHKTSLFSRAAAFALALALAIPAAYATAGEKKLETTTRIVDGLTYRNTVSVNNGSRVESNSFELSPYSVAKPILVQGDGTIYGAATINRAVSRAQAQGYHVLGGINTDFFVMSTGVPIGVVVEDGVYKSGCAGENIIAIDAGAVSILETPRVDLTLSIQSSGRTITPHNFNKTRHNSGGLYLLNEYFSTVSSRSDGSGWYVRMKAMADPFTGRVPDLTVNTSLTLEVTELFQSDKSVTIGPGEYILTASTLAGYSDSFAAFQLGDRVTLTTSCNNAGLSGAQWACGVGDIIVRDGAVTDSSGWTYAQDGRQPRTALGLKPDGTVILYTVDGRQSGYSVGLSEKNLAEELLSQGCTSAVNLDGGGSTSFSLWTPGKSGPALRNKPSGGSARACATYLLLVTDQRGDGWPDRLVLPEEGQVVLTGSSVTLPQAVAIDSGLNPVSADLSGLTYTSTGGRGTVQGNVYTAGYWAGTDTLGLSAGILEGTAQIHIVDQLTEFKVTRAGSSSALTALNVEPGEQIQLAVTGSYWGRTALRDFGPVACSVQGDVGTVDENGLFTASETPGSGSITFSARGLTQTIQITMANAHQDIPAGHWAYDAVEYCYAKGIVSGVSDTQFGGVYPISRANFIVMLYNAMGKPAVSAPCTFHDVPADAYYAPALAWAQQNELSSGVGGGNFAPFANITREQAFAMLYRFLPIAGKSCPDGSLSVLDKFTDRDQLSSYARQAAATLVSQGLVSGSGANLNPQNTLARAEMAALLYRVLEHTPVTDVPTDPVTPDTPTDPGVSGNHLLALDQSQVTLASGGSVTLKASILPAVSGASVTWTSSDPSAAAVSPGGMVTNLYAGARDKAVIVTASWNGQSASCTVTCQRAQRVGTVTGADTGLNVRSGPGAEYGKVGGLRNSSQVVVLGQEPGWYQILFLNPSGQAAIGYVSADYLVVTP